MKAQTRISSNEPPEGAHCFIDGQHFKVGRFSRVFVYRNDEWVFTNGMTLEKLSREIHKQAIKEDLDRTIKGYVL